MVLGASVFVKVVESVGISVGTSVVFANRTVDSGETNKIYVKPALIYVEMQTKHL